MLPPSTNTKQQLSSGESLPHRAQQQHNLQPAFGLALQSIPDGLCVSFTQWKEAAKTGSIFGHMGESTEMGQEGSLPPPLHPARHLLGGGGGGGGLTAGKSQGEFHSCVFQRQQPRQQERHVSSVGALPWSSVLAQKRPAGTWPEKSPPLSRPPPFPQRKTPQNTPRSLPPRSLPCWGTFPP